MNKYPLNSVAEVVRGVTFSKSEGTTTPSDDRLPVIRAGSIQKSLLLGEGQIWIPANKIKSNQMIRKNDIVMCTSSGSSDLVGKCAKSTQDWNGSFGAFCAGIRADESKCSSSYLYHFLCSPHFRNWTKSSSGANIKNIRASELAAFKIPLPPLEEQKRIAAILDKADAIRRKRQKAIDLTDQLLRSVFLDIFGDPVTNPKGWPIESLGDHLSFVTSGSRGWAKYYSDDGALFIRSLDVRMNELVFNEAAFVSPPDNAEARRTLVLKGDVLLTITGSRIGRVAPVREDLGRAHISQHVAIMRPKETINAEFLAMFLSDINGGQKQIKESSYGQTKPGLNLEQIKNFQVPAPPIELQVQYLQAALKIRNFSFSLDKKIEETNKLIGSLNIHAFRGDLIKSTKAA